MSARSLILPALAAACLAGVAGAQVAVPPPAAPVPAAPAKPAAPAAGPLVSDPGARDAQDVVFLGETGPVLLRLHVLVNGKPFPDAWDEFLGKLFAHYDVDGDGVLDKKEMGRILGGQEVRTLFSGQADLFNFRPNFAKAEEVDTDKDGKVTREELSAYYRKFAGRTLRAEQSQGGTSGRLTAALFRYLDLDKDGKLSQDELAAAPASLHRADLDDDEMISTDELLPASNQMYATIGGGTPAPPLADSSPFQVLIPGTSQDRLIKQLLARYDKDRNQKLSPAEIGLDKEAFDRLDTNHDGQLDAGELAGWVGRPPDLELVVQLGQPAAPGKTPSIFDPLVELSKMLSKKDPVDVFNPTGRKMPLASAVRKEGQALVLKLPDALIEVQRGNASQFNGGFNARQFFLQQFDQLDTDKKGYLERKLVDQPQAQFLRGLFDLADRDGDGKLYKKEVNAFLDLQAAGAAANTSLKITDQGRGLFELLDANGDGRLSVRELRTAWTRLAPWDRDGDGRLAEAEVPRQFLAAVDQGQVSLPFRVAVAPFNVRRNQAQQAPKGPLWFRKMDRNNDGDVSFREWLGTEEEFRRFDTDGDGLISPEEAERADALMKKDKETKETKEAKR
jgi:Ca2+-binding EF-hand superfamily protein